LFERVNLRFLNFTQLSSRKKPSGSLGSELPFAANVIKVRNGPYSVEKLRSWPCEAKYFAAQADKLLTA
jgi:hypothetical protein